MTDIPADWSSRWTITGTGTMRVKQLILASCMLVLGLAACSNYKATLMGEDHSAFQAGEPIGETLLVLPQGEAIDPDAKVLPPAPVEQQRVVEGKPTITDPGGYVRLRFDVSDVGTVTRVRIVDAGVDQYDKDRTDQEQYEQEAIQLIETWQMTPGTVNGQPAAFQDVETVMRFDEYTSEGEEAGEVVGDVAVVVGEIALGVVVTALYVVAVAI